MHRIKANLSTGFMTLLFFVLCSSSALSDITYTFYLDGVDSTIANTIKASVTQAVSLYNQNGSFNKSLYIYYSSGVPTAQANYDGVITFGGSRNTRVALHEILHTLGVGTLTAWSSNLSGGVWIGSYGAAKIQELDGTGALLYGDSAHFWPYGLNYDSEDSGAARLGSIRMMAALAADMGFVSFVDEPTCQNVAAGGTAAFSVTVANASTYVWYKKGSLTALSNGGDISGATSSTLQIANVSTEDEGLYYCVSGGLISRPAALIVIPTTSKLVGQWDMNGNIDDSAGAMDGYPTGSPAYTAGYMGQAIDLDGTDNYITLPAGTINYDDITIAAWIYWDSSSSWQRIFDFGNNTSQYMFLTPLASSTMRFSIKNGGSEEVINTTTMSTGEWMHVAVTLSGNTGSLYVNGTLEATNTSMTIDPSDFNPQYNYIGYSQYIADPLFNGQIDDFRLYNYALSASEVATLADQTYAPSTKLTISSATAGAEESGNPAVNSFDGDATTRWCNDNVLANAWIEYDLGAVYDIDEIQLLFYKQTIRTYPIVIAIDDVQVFSGNTTMSNDYFRATFNTVSGRYITVSMAAANSDSSYWFSIYEVAIWQSSEGEEDTTPPAAPTGLAATAGNASVTLNWNDNSESDLASYNVKRSTISGGSYTTIATGLTTSAYTDTAVTNGTTYYYVVSAVDTSSNESSNSSEVSATPTAPSSVTLLEDGFETSFDKWTDGGTTDWDRTTSYKYSGSYSAHAGSSDNDLVSDNLDTSGYTSITIEFWFRDDDIDDSDDIYLQLYNGSSYVNFYELGNSTEDTWNYYSVTLSSSSYSQYFRSNFRIKFEGTSIDSGENLWIDDVKITAQ